MTPSPPESEVDAACQALAGYLDALQAGQRPSRGQVLEKFPQLANELACLEALERLSASSASGVVAASVIEGPAPTLPLAGGGTKSGETGLAPLTLFGHYELLKQLGRGGMGVVYLARDRKLDRLVALKMISAGQLASDMEVHRFRAEAQAAARLSHSHLASVFEYGEFEGRHYIAMQYLEGESLVQRLHEQRRTPDDIARLVATVARAVQYLHEHGLVHRDLKPSNILFNAAGEPCVTDFGLVKTLSGGEALTHTGDVVGTPYYMAPEQASGGGAAVGPLSDVYSLGVILYELLVGRPPFQGNSTLDTLLLVLKGEPEAPRRLNPRAPRELELLCLRCLAKDPAQRIGSAGELANELERYVRREPLQTRAPSLWQRTVRWVRREPPLVSHLAAILSCYSVYVIYQLTWGEWLADFEAELATILGAWLLAAVLFQRLMANSSERPWWHIPWALTDVVMLTLTVRICKALTSPLMVLYPLLIVAAGLRFRAGSVWLTTLLSIIAVASLLAESYANGTPMPEPYRHVIFMLALLVIGAITAYQVHRVRSLSRYFEQRPGKE